jgi:hypothetical protein
MAYTSHSLPECPSLFESSEPLPTWVRAAVSAMGVERGDSAVAAGTA